MGDIKVGVSPQADDLNILSFTGNTLDTEIWGVSVMTIKAYAFVLSVD